MKALDQNQIRIRLITCFSAFILGYINAHGVLFAVGALVSPQTGNLVHMAISLGSGDATRLIGTILIFTGFLLGCFFSTSLFGRMKDQRKEFFVTWSIFFLPIFLNWLLIGIIPTWAVKFSLSFISGVGLCFFRKIGNIEINNNIVTGNMRFIGNALFSVLFRGDKSKALIFWTFTLATFLFFLGALVLTLLSGLGSANALLVIVIIGLIPYLIGLGLARESSQGQ